MLGVDPSSYTFPFSMTVALRNRGNAWGICLGDRFAEYVLGVDGRRLFER